MVKTLLMSIKPAYSTRIFDGTKKFELRRTAVRVTPGDRVVVYASSPIQAVVGWFTVKSVVRMRPSQLWNEHHAHFGVTAKDYFDYFEGKATAHAIEVSHVRAVSPVPLSILRRRMRHFRPPQSYMTWTRKTSDLTSARRRRAPARTRSTSL